MVKAGLGIGFVPLEFLKEENLNNISIINLEEAIPTRGICLITRKDVPLSIAAKRLEEMLFDI